MSESTDETLLDEIPSLDRLREGLGGLSQEERTLLAAMDPDTAQTTEYLHTLARDIDALLVSLNKWRSYSASGSVEFSIVMNQSEAERNLIDARESVDKLIASVEKEHQRIATPVPICQCHETDNSLCSIHTVSHFYQEGCCDQPKESHRHMTGDEYDATYPEVFNEVVNSPAEPDRRLRVDARKYKRRIGLTITQLFPDDDNAGLCFDMSLQDLKAIMPSLERLVQITE